MRSQATNQIPQPPKRWLWTQVPMRCNNTNEKGHRFDWERDQRAHVLWRHPLRKLRSSDVAGERKRVFPVWSPMWRSEDIFRFSRYPEKCDVRDQMRTIIYFLLDWFGFGGSVLVLGCRDKRTRFIIALGRIGSCFWSRFVVFFERFVCERVNCRHGLGGWIWVCLEDCAF